VIDNRPDINPRKSDRRPSLTLKWEDTEPFEEIEEKYPKESLKGFSWREYRSRALSQLEKNPLLKELESAWGSEIFKNR